MEYGSIIKRAWQITWRHKALWVLGIFAGVSGCQGGGGGGGQGGSGDFSGMGDGPGGMKTPDVNRFLDQLDQWLPVLVAAAVFLALVGFLWWVLSVAARGALIAGVSRIEDGQSPRLGELWSGGFSRFWALFGLDLLLGLPVMLVFVGLMAGVFVPLIAGFVGGGEPGPEVLAPICGTLGLGVPLLLVLSFVMGILDLIARRYLVLGGQRVFESLGNAWRFFRARFKDSLVMWLINFGLNIVASFALAIPAFVIGVVVAVPAIMSVTSGNWEALVPTVAAAAVLIMLLSTAYSAVWGTFTSALWTLFFRRAAGMQPAVAEPLIASAAFGSAPMAEPPYQAPPAPEPPYQAPPPAPPYQAPPPVAPEPGPFPQNPPEPPAPGV